jgi:hypothetical protein
MVEQRPLVWLAHRTGSGTLPCDPEDLENQFDKYWRRPWPPPTQSIRLAGALSSAGATVELELVPGATHFWHGASDVPGIVRRSVGFLRALG